MSSSQSQCTASTAFGTAVSITFGIIYGLILIGVSFYSHNVLMQYNEKFKSSSCNKRLKIWIMDVYKRRRCYAPIITHLADMVTDFAVVVQFAELSVTRTADECGIQMWYLFGLSIFVLLLYRTISSLLIYQSTKSITRALIQWIDFELFRALYINYLCDKKEPCSPQRWITSLEAAFESTPQALIQTIFLVKTKSFGQNPVVVASLVFSLWSIISKIISDDRVISIREAKYIYFRHKLKTYKSCSCVSTTFVIRYLWRILDVSSRILITSLLWLVLGGVYLSFIIGTECLIILTICLWSKKWEFLFGVVAIVVSKSTQQTKLLSKALMMYRSLSNIIFMSIVTALIYMTSIKDCWKCSDYDDRQQYREANSEIFIIFVYCWFTVIITPILCIYLTLNVFIGTKSTSRTIDVMIKSQDWNGIIEMQAYKGDYGVYNQETNENLLMLAVQHNYGKLVNHLASGNKVEFEGKTNEGETLLDFVMHSIKNDNYKMNKKYMGQLLIKISNQHPNITTKDENGNVVYAAAYIGDITSYDLLRNSNKFDSSNCWKFAIDGDQPEIIEHIMNDYNDKEPLQTAQFLPLYAHDWEHFCREMITRKKQNLVNYLLGPHHTLSAQPELIPTLWFLAVENSDLNVVKAMEKYVDNVNHQNDSGHTVLHITMMKDAQERDMNVINYLKTIIDPNITDSVKGWKAEQYFTSLRITDGMQYKIVIMGGGGCGKTTLVTKFRTGLFEEEYDPTIEDEYKKTMEIDGYECELNILDTAGQEEFSSMQDQWMREGEIFILVYSITSTVTFDEVIILREKTLRAKDEEIVPFVLVGNKCDLDDQRQVSLNEGQGLSSEWDCSFFETSAKEDINVTEIFEAGVKKYWAVHGYA